MAWLRAKLRGKLFSAKQVFWWNFPSKYQLSRNLKVDLNQMFWVATSITSQKTRDSFKIICGSQFYKHPKVRYRDQQIGLLIIQSQASWFKFYPKFDGKISAQFITSLHASLPHCMQVFDNCENNRLPLRRRLCLRIIRSSTNIFPIWWGFFFMFPEDRESKGYYRLHYLAIFKWNIQKGLVSGM